MTEDVTPTITVSTALQAVFECLDQLPQPCRSTSAPGYTDCLLRVRRARTELQTWVQEQRG